MAGQQANYLEPLYLKNLFGNVAFSVPATLYLALFTDTNTTAQRNAGTVTEVTGNGYSRLPITNNTTDWPAPVGSNPSQTSNGIVLTMAVPTPLDWGIITAFGIYDAATVGNLLYWGDLLGTEKVATVTSATPAVVTCPAHGFVQHDLLKFSAVPGIPVPTGMTDGLYYYVLGTGLTTDQFQFATTDGGTAINTTGSGGGKFGKSQRVTTNVNVAPSFAVGALVIQSY